MSRPSTNSTSKISTQLSSKSAWSKGPPRDTSVPTPRSQSPAPSTPVNATHSRRPSTLGPGVPVKDGVSVPRNNVGAVKQGSPVTFGSIDDISAPISSSPAAAPPIKSEGVRSFGSVPNTHVNGKASISSRSSAGPSNTSSSTPAVSVPATLPKMQKMDIHKLFQNPSSQPSTAETASPSTRPSALPSQTPSTPASQPSSSSQPPFPTFVPGSRSQPQISGPGAGPRSPVYPRQLANGSGPRSQPGPSSGPSQVSTGMSSPRLGPHPHPAQPSTMPPPPPPSMQPQMQPPMQPPMHTWPGYYYTPTMPDQHYMQHYPGTWYMPPSTGHPPHPPPGPHAPGMPMSPRNPPQPLQGPGTPTLSHATPNPVPHPLPPISHAPSGSMSSMSSPPPTPASALPGSARLNANSTAFVPGGTSRPKVVLKNPQDGSEVNLETLTKSSPAPSSGVTPSTSSTLSNVPGTPTRRPTNIRMESEEQRRMRLEVEEMREKEKARLRAEAEEKLKKEKEEEERKKKEEEARKKREEEEKERDRIRKEEEEKERIRKEEEEKQRLRKEEEEKERLKKEEEERERQRKVEEEQERLRREEERKRKEEEERERIRLAEEKAREEERVKEEERIRKQQEEEEIAKAKAAALAVAESQAEQSEAAKVTDGDLTQEPEDGELGSLKEESKDKPKDSLRIDTVLSTKRRPGPLDLSQSRQPSSPLTLARPLGDLTSVTYPEGIMSPKPELNAGAKEGKFRYDRDFLLQFMQICKEKPESLPPLDAIGIEPVDQLSLSRGGSGRHRQMPGASAPTRQSSIGVGLPGVGPKFTMGAFATSTTKFVPGVERFDSVGNRSVSTGGPIMPFRNPPLQRTASQGGPGPMQSRTRSKRGEKRPTDGKIGANGGLQAHHGGFGGHGPGGAAAVHLEPVVPLQVSENRWERKQFDIVDPESAENVDRKVKGLLNKLTMEKFDSISDQIIQWANKSENEKDGRTLIRVIRLVFEKATDEATWSEMYARLCRKMMEQISPKVQDDGIKNTEGKPITGGQLFRKYLLNRCQEDFERGWFAKEATAAAAASKALEDQAVKAANETGNGEVALYSDEYYAAQKAKRQGLGLIKFIGELFKLQMLTERIMHECVKKLLGNVQNPEEEEIESLCKLLTTVGSLLDTQKARAHMDVYFQRMKELTSSPNVSPRMRFMLQDVIELRERKWVARNAVAAPTTLAQIHEAAAKEKAAQDKEASQRISMSRGGSRRGGNREDYPQPNPDGWTVTGSTSRANTRAGDLSHFGRISKAQPITTLGPSSVFAGKKESKREPLSRTNSHSNMFQMLTEAPADKGPTEPTPQRKKLVLQPRSKPLDEPNRPDETGSPAEEEIPAPTELPEAAAKAKIEEDIKEFFNVRNLDEAENYFTDLPAQYHQRLVDQLITKTVEAKETDAKLVSDLFARAKSKGLCTPESYEEGFGATAEMIEDIAIDAPMAWTLFATMVKGAGLDEERLKRLASKSTDSVKLLGLLL
ncbi:hypothetical protein AMATHDRAFT_57504 [Amanita thiersii Skay4041]|uniref:MI domain-containing protein n=1 Tax=Amanita thiersii Skay4041 TaxID=703135 RepID=A0A2A9NWF7_9AGAR|nr:hypothetical protein AMATHDRAFT_57504 [Amanita thiersii Skay4041]